jgi:hypothetical protein
VLLLLLVFVLANGQRAEASFFGTYSHCPMGVALLLAAVVGIRLVAAFRDGPYPSVPAAGPPPRSACGDHGVTAPLRPVPNDTAALSDTDNGSTAGKAGT